MGFKRSDSSLVVVWLERTIPCALHARSAQIDVLMLEDVGSPGQAGRRHASPKAGTQFVAETKPASVISCLCRASSCSRNFTMSGPVRKLGFNACFSM